MKTKELSHTEIYERLEKRISELQKELNEVKQLGDEEFAGYQFFLQRMIQMYTYQADIEYCATHPDYLKTFREIYKDTKCPFA